MLWRYNQLVLITCITLSSLVLGACHTETTTTAPVPTEQPTSSPTASPTPERTQNNLILFSSYRDGESELYTMGADGSNITRLTDIDERANQPAWSPDGKWIAFVQRFDGYNSEIMAMPFGEGNPILSTFRLTHSRALDVEPDWSPDGTQIAFTSTRSGNMHIWVMMANGSRRTQLTQDHTNNGQIWNSSPKWSPDGSKILYRSDLGVNNEIFIMNADGTNQRNLTNHPASDVDPAWSPDGSQITFVSDRDGNEEIYIMDADGKNLQRLTNHFEKDTYPAWSPDGRQIAFYSMREGNYEVFTINSDGSEITQLTDHYNFDGFPAWQPTQFESSSISISFEPDKGGYLPAPDPSTLSWMKENTIQINLDNIGSNQFVFDTLSKQIGERRAVDLGNPYLGVQESLQVQKEIIFHLVTQMGFDTLIFDIDWVKGMALDAYLHAGEGDLAQILAEFPDPRWHSREALEFIEQLQEHNQNSETEPGLRAFGVRIPNPSRTMDIVLAYLEAIDPEDKEHVEKLFSCFRTFEDDWREYYYAYFRSQGECRHKLGQAYELIHNRQERYSAASSEGDYAQIIHAMRGVQQAEEAFRAIRAELTFIDENIRWVVDQRGDAAKYILMGQNVAASSTNTQIQVYAYQFLLGRLMRPILGAEPFTIGFSFGSGQIVTTDICVEPSLLGPTNVLPFPNQSFEWLAHYAGYPALILFLDQSNPQALGSEWLAQPIPTRLIGGQYAPTLAEDYFIELDLLKTFDAMIYLDKVSPTVLLP